jgi:hypothetical protein
MDSGCSRHMIGNKEWFSNLTLLSHKEYVTFRDDKKGKIKVNEHFTSKVVALVEHLRCKFLSGSLVLDDGLEISF